MCTAEIATPRLAVLFEGVLPALLVLSYRELVHKIRSVEDLKEMFVVIQAVQYSLAALVYLAPCEQKYAGDHCRGNARALTGPSWPTARAVNLKRSRVG